MKLKGRYGKGRRKEEEWKEKKGKGRRKEWEKMERVGRGEVEKKKWKGWEMRGKGGRARIGREVRNNETESPTATVFISFFMQSHASVEPTPARAWLI